ncbi:hypothetical protein EVAR_24161_1 [Eumeta japonica]|uniref:Uncharacterized protein n=1 Tax=Eumeta variegata TaxID=151549 RepID=A0A4C1W3R5_EUMVA|nr:hypothetical protein EVAR_24161_1 [Eumeta japonica]
MWEDVSAAVTAPSPAAPPARPRDLAPAPAAGRRRLLRGGRGDARAAPAPALAVRTRSGRGGRRAAGGVSYHRYQKIDTGLFILRRAVCGLIRFRMEITEAVPQSKPLSCMFYEMVVAPC